MTFATSALQLIGNTPLLKVSRLDTGCCELFLKLESQNPGGSIKDRIAVSMIEAAELSGALKPGGTIVEASAGNTGLALGLVALLKGYQAIIVMPDKMSKEKINHLRSLGAKVIITRSDVNKGHPEYYQDMADSLAKTIPNSCYINQFANPANTAAHQQTTGPEIWSQMQARIDAIVVGVGTGGTLSGLGKFLREKNPAIDILLADPKGSILADYVNHGTLGKAGSWLVEGIGEDFIPSICDIDLVSQAYTISDKEAFLAARMLLQKEGILGGSTTGVLLQTALLYCRAQTTPKRVVSFVCDTGNKYLSKLYNDYWMLDQGFLSRPTFGDLRDIISHHNSDSAIVTVNPEEPLSTVHNRMRLHDVSQLPVIDKQGALVGIVDETDLLMAVYRSDSAFAYPVRQIMSTKLELISKSESIDKLMEIFSHDYTAIVMDNDQFFGIITKIDLINFLRRKNL